MKPGDLVRIKYEGHWLVGQAALVVEDAVTPIGLYEDWILILAEGKTMKVPKEWVVHETR